MVNALHREVLLHMPEAPGCCCCCCCCGVSVLVMCHHAGSAGGDIQLSVHAAADRAVVAAMVLMARDGTDDGDGDGDGDDDDDDDDDLSVN